MRIAVVGRGLIGAAAARHLTKAGADVVLIGPDEPEAPATHRGVFASHYDSGRISRQLDSQMFWSEVSRASIARYDEIATQGGVSFFKAVGTLHAAAADAPWLAGIGAVQAASQVPAEHVSGAAASARFPMFAFPSDWAVWVERDLAGYLDPRALVQAQTRAAERAGAHVVPAQADGFDETDAGVVVRVGADRIHADRILVAAGGFSQALLAQALPLTVYARTIAFFEVDGAEQARLAGMPTLVSQLADGNDPYVLPPIRYPDGRFLLKLGGDPVDVVLRDVQDTKDWFRSGGSDDVCRWLAEHMAQRMPGLRYSAVTKGACVTSFTPADRPLIDRISPNVALAVAGCGRGAKCSDELGRLASHCVLGHPPHKDLTWAAVSRPR